MGIISRKETDRDLALIKDYMEKNDSGKWKYSITQLGLKYARIDEGVTFPLTPTRIHQILDKHQIAKTRVPVKPIIIRKKRRKKSKKKNTVKVLDK